MSLIVNRRDLDFLFYECLGIDALFRTQRYQGVDRVTIDGVLDVAQAIAEDLYLPFAGALDANEPRFVDGKVEIMPQVGEALRAYADAGFFASSMDQDLGGLQLPYVVSMAANGMFTAANLSVANYSFLTIANANLIATFGDESQKMLFLPPLLQGRWFGTMCLSEPQAGSSLSDITTLAEPREDGSFRVKGSKMWISGGDHEIVENIVHLVLARTPGAPPGVKGISLFIVPKRRVGPDGAVAEDNGVQLAGLNHKMGHRGTTNCLLNFGEAGESIGFLVGERHRGLSYMFHMMNEARIGVGLASTMSALAGFLYSAGYARTRLQGRAPNGKDPLAGPVAIIDHADVKRMLLAQKAAVEGAQALCAYCALLVDLHRASSNEEERTQLSQLLDLLTPIAKSWPSEHCLEANKWAMQVLGGYGYTRDYPLERLYRDNRLNHIHEGAFGIQAIDLLGRKVRLKKGEALRLLAAQICETVDQARSAGGLSDEADGLAAAVDAILDATASVLACPQTERGLANATLYLDAFGHVVVAWLWLRQALSAASGVSAAQGSDVSFYAGKLASCRYFFRYELPKIHHQLGLVSSLDDTCLSVEPNQILAP
jgi:butyryl-CoA dehydrogenase